jgi:hypothetical protein
MSCNILGGGFFTTTPRGLQTRNEMTVKKAQKLGFQGRIGGGEIHHHDR